MRQKKSLTKKEIARLDQEIISIQESPAIGDLKKGDLSGVFVHKFKIENRLFLLAYEYSEEEILLLTMGPHENFYRSLKLHPK